MWSPLTSSSVPAMEICATRPPFSGLTSTTASPDSNVFTTASRAAVWHPAGDQILGVQNQLGNSALHLLDATGKLLEVLWQGTGKEVIGAPHWSPDGAQLVAAVWRAGQWGLQLFDITTRTWSTLTNDAAIEAHARLLRTATAWCTAPTTTACTTFNGWN